METRSYSLLTITKADAATREIFGTMSTPETDRVGDQVMPDGMQARLPAPCLWQHDHGDPIGEIVWVDPQPNGIRFKAKLAQVDGPPSLKEKLDGYFELIRRGLVKGISIGFRPLAMEPIATGWLIRSWELLEASVVTIPANASCTIEIVKALAKNTPGGVRVTSAPKRSPVVKLDPVTKARMNGTLKIHADPRNRAGEPFKIRKIKTNRTVVVKLERSACTWLDKSTGPHVVVKLSEADKERGRRRMNTRVVKLERR
jgi:HK97 family phage prohead protease